MKKEKIFYWLRMVAPMLLIIPMFARYGFMNTLPALFGMIIVVAYIDKLFILELSMAMKMSHPARFLYFVLHTGFWIIIAIVFSIYFFFFLNKELYIVGTAAVIIQVMWLPFLTFTNLGNFISQKLFPSKMPDYVIHHTCNDNEFLGTSWFASSEYEQAKEHFDALKKQSHVKCVVFVINELKCYRVGCGNETDSVTLMQELKGLEKHIPE